MQVFFGLAKRQNGDKAKVNSVCQKRENSSITRMVIGHTPVFNIAAPI
jgi:hypothetical protein